MPTRRHFLASAAAMAATPLLSKYGIGPTGNAPPHLGPSQPTHYRFELGDLEVTTILDAGAMLDGPWPIVGEDRPETEVQQLMRENLLPERTFQPGFTPTLVNTGTQLILFDAGNGANGFVPRPGGGWLASLLGPAGFAAEQVDVVVLTHGHPDHIGGLIELGKPFLPNARYVIGEVEYNFWSAKARLSGATADWARIFQSNVVTLADRMSFLKPEAEVAPGMRAFAAYGHTPGHLAFHIESRGKRLLLWADAAHHQVASLRHPDWHCVFDMDKAMGAATRKRIYDMATVDRLPVVGYHMPFPSLGFVERADGGYRWLPVSYQLNL